MIYTAMQDMKLRLEQPFLAWNAAL